MAMLGLRLALCPIAFALSAPLALAQGGPPPPPPPPGPLQPPPQPPQNLVTQAKINLGKTIFFEEQLSSTRTVACATCHIASVGGSDPRSTRGDMRATNPGPDGVYGTLDDITGSPGVPLTEASGVYSWAASFGLDEQVTPRKSRTMINAAYGPTLFWDGRATGTFTDPLTGAVVIPNGGALESQVISPPIGSVEMAHIGRDWNDVAARLASVRPLALSPAMGAQLMTYVNGRSYPELFAEAFGTPDVTPVRIAMAIATYERILFTNQTPFDAFLGGNAGALTPLEQQGRGLFNTLGCNACHAGALTSDNQFHYIGVRPVNDDLGRFTISNNPADRGAFRTPSLRNAELRGPYMHNGEFATLEEVVDFYNRGGDFNAPNRNPLIRPLGLNQQQKDALVAFLKRPLTDQRVVNGAPPFDRPSLYTESSCGPQVVGAGTPGSGGFTPTPVAIEPPIMGNPSFAVAVWGALGGASSVLVVDTADPGAGPNIQATASFAHIDVPLAGAGDGAGFGSVSLAIPNDPAFVGTTLFGRWYVLDPAAPNGVAASPAFKFTIFAVCRDAACVADINGDGQINATDLALLLGAWSQSGGPADFNGDGVVNAQDLATLLGSWGVCG